jgi:hypothetical protein
MKNKSYKKSLVIGIIILFIGASILPVTSGKLNTLNFDKSTNFTNLADNQEKTYITIYAFGDTLTKEKKILIPTNEALKIYNDFEYMTSEIALNPLSDKTQILKNNLVELLDDKDLLPAGITKKDYLSLLTPNLLKNSKDQEITLKIYNLLANLINTIKNPFFNKVINNFKNRFIGTFPPPVNPSVIGSATYCSVAGFGYGSTHPIFITPRPRILLIWNAHVGDTWVGEIFTDKGFYAWGTQIGTALGFTGGGMTLGIPLGNLFAFGGYAWYTSILANYIHYNPQ